MGWLMVAVREATGWKVAGTYDSRWQAAQEVRRLRASGQYARIVVPGERG